MATAFMNPRMPRVEPWTMDTSAVQTQRLGPRQLQMSSPSAFFGCPDAGRWLIAFLRQSLADSCLAALVRWPKVGLQ